MRRRSVTGTEWSAVLAGSTSLAVCPDEQFLLQDLCENAVKAGGHQLAWYARVAYDGTYRLVHAAAAGPAIGYQEGLAITWDDRPCGMGPGGMAVKTGQIITASDIEHAGLEEPVRQRALRYGLRSLTAIPVRSQGRIDGVLGIYSDRVGAFDDLANSILLALCQQAGAGLDRLRATDQLTEALHDTIAVLSATLDARDPHTAGHQASVSAVSAQIAHYMGMDDFEVQGVAIGALVHDIGKIGVPIELLLRPTPLTPVERLLVQEHATIGERVLSVINFPWPVAQCVGQHHERLDGSGYPRALSGSQILPSARIVMVADVFDAMTAHRPYRQGIDRHIVLDYLTDNADVLFDADVVRALAAVVADDLQGDLLPSASATATA